MNFEKEAMACFPKEIPGLPTQLKFGDLNDIVSLDSSQAGFQDSPWLWGETWNIGIIPHPFTDVFAEPGLLANAQWLFAKSRTDYFCDPWLVENESEMVLFYERFNRKSGRGIICSAFLRRGTDGWALENHQTVIEESFHISHPCVFNYKERWYLIPEAADSGSIIIYEAVDFPFHWGPGKVLISGFHGVDPVLVHRDGFFWLFCGNGGTDHDANLHAFFSNSPFGPWTPHLANPIVTGLKGSRPAGPPFFFTGKLIRPAQDCRFTYGQALVFNEILKLSPTEFRESPIMRLSPPSASPYPHGLHSICHSGELCVVDGKSFSAIKRLYGPSLVRIRKTKHWWDNVNV
ncbi:MAG: hypothetical protein DRI46_12585 [Chloroflexi bacterium]|nr:MAG: hypothetical protein DRI46_12585 [Chloroflexota bacterium]